MCRCPDVCQTTPTRLNVRLNRRELYSLQPGAPPVYLTDNHPGRTCWNPHTNGGAVSSDVPLTLLATCRQIYHEAVLKPFSQISFIYDPSPFVSDDLGSFLDALVPAQARAIAHLRLMAEERNFPTARTIKRLGKLERLHICLVGDTYISLQQVLNKGVQRFEGAPGFNAIGKLCLGSLRITYEAGVFGMNDLNDSEAAAEAIIKWLEDTETRLLQPAT